MEVSTTIDIGTGATDGDEVITEDNPERAGEEAPPVVDEISEVPEDEPVVEITPIAPGKTELRQLLATPTRELAFEIRAAGCPAKPEMLDALNEFTEETPRGIVFDMLWVYFGYNN